MSQSSLFIFVIVLGVLFSTLLTGLGSTFTEENINVNQISSISTINGFDVPFSYVNRSSINLLLPSFNKYDLYVWDAEHILIKSGLQNQIDGYNTLNAEHSGIFILTIEKKSFLSWRNVRLNLRASVSPEQNEMEAISYWITSYEEDFESLTNLASIIETEISAGETQQFYFYENQNDMMNAYIGLNEYQSSLREDLNMIRLNFARGLSYIPIGISVPLGLIYGLIIGFLIYRAFRGY